MGCACADSGPEKIVTEMTELRRSAAGREVCLREKTALSVSFVLSFHRGWLILSAALGIGVLGAIPAMAQTPFNPPPAKLPQPEKPANNVSAAATGAVTGALTLKEAITLALRLQPQLTSAAANRQQAEERVNQVRAGYFPTLSPRYNLNDQYSYGATTQFVQGPNGTTQVTVNRGDSFTTKGAQISAGWQLFDSGSRELSNRQARQSLRSTQYGEQNTRQSVISNVADSYFTALRDRALVKVSESQVTRTQNTLDVIKAQVAVGTAPAKDVLQAQADLLNAQVNLIVARNNAALSIASLKNAIGIVNNDPLTLADLAAPTDATPTTATIEDKSAAAPAAASAPADEATVNALINQYTATAFRLRPDISESLQALDSTKTSVRLAKVNAGLQASGNVAYNNSIDPDKFNNSLSNDRSFQLTLSYPLFDGGLGRAQVRQNQAAVRGSEANLESLKQQVAVEVEQAYRTLAQSRAAIPASQAALTAAEKNYAAALASRKEGVGSIVEVITAETALTQAQTNYFQAIFSFYAADARLAKAVGQADKVGNVGATSGQ